MSVTKTELLNSQIAERLLSESGARLALFTATQRQAETIISMVIELLEADSRQANFKIAREELKLTLRNGQGDERVLSAILGPDKGDMRK